MVLVERDLVRLRYVALLARGAQRIVSGPRTYHLVGPLLGRQALEDPGNVYDVRIAAVPLYGLAVHLEDVDGPAEVVGVRQTPAAP